MLISSPVYRLIGFFILPLLWLICADIFEIASPLLLPPLALVFKRLNILITSGSIFTDLFFTLYRWACGFSFGVIAGIVVGLLLGISLRLRSIFEFPLEFIRSMPITAIFPLFLIVFGIGDPSKIAMAFTPTFLLMVVNTSYGVILSDPTRRKMAAIFGASRFQIFRLIVAMDALPQIFVGLRLAVAQSLIVVVVSEMFIGTDYGLGQRVYDSYLTNSVPTLYALLIVLGVVGYSANKLLIFAEARLIFWTGK
jgi:NitT/TauT family transport system permease protein